MNLVTLIGPAGSWKSTTAYGLMYVMKKLGLKVEYIDEFAREAVYDNRIDILSDQLFILAQQNQKQNRILRAGLDYAVSDTCLLLGLVYAPDNALPQLKDAITAYYNLYDNITFYLPRNPHSAYHTEGRVQATPAEADSFIPKIEAVLPANTIRLAPANDYVMPILEHLGLADDARKLKMWW